MAATITLRVKSNYDRRYKNAVEHASSFNAQLSRERRLRLPFLDSQTGVAQNHSQLLHSHYERRPGCTKSQLYQYPQRHWHTKKRPFPVQEPKGSAALGDNPVPRGGESGCVAADIHTITSVENPAVAAAVVVEDTVVRIAPVKDVGGGGGGGDEFFEEWDNLSEPLDAGEIDRRDTDSSDYEDSYNKRKKKKAPAKKTPKSSGGGRGKRKAANTEKAAENDEDKPYACEHCGVRYKTRPGLSYHVNHHHNKSEEEDSQDARAYTVSPKPSGSAVGVAVASSAPLLAPVDPALPGGSKRKENSKYCDFCLGDEMENKKTGQKEELVSCADCGRSGHPTCLQFTANMIISVRKYPWQCIECKSCGLCGTSDNDDQLLFCDDCDRGYHMYCLNPPLSEPPEGSWSCHLCIREFYGGQKPPSMQ